MKKYNRSIISNALLGIIIMSHQPELVFGRTLFKSKTHKTQESESFKKESQPETATQNGRKRKSKTSTTFGNEVSYQGEGVITAKKEVSEESAEVDSDIQNTALAKREKILEEQQTILDEHESERGKNYGELDLLTRQGFTVTEAGLQDLIANFGFAVTRVNLFEGRNLDMALMQALSLMFSLSEAPENVEAFVKQNNFIIGSFNLPNIISKNSDLQQAILRLRDLLQDVDLTTTAKLADAQMDILEKLRAIHNLLIDDAEISTTDQFVMFIDAMEKAYQMLIKSRIANENLEKYRTREEENMQSITRSTTGYVEGNIPFVGGVATAGVNMSATKGEGYSDTAFYSTNSSVAVKGKVGVTAGVAKGEVGVTGKVTKSKVAHSYEQAVDHIKDSEAVMLSGASRKISEQREEVQDATKSMSIYQANIVEPLKTWGIWPLSVRGELPPNPKSAAPVSFYTYNVTGDVSIYASAFATFGAQATAGKNIVVYNKENPLISLISSDCSPAIGIKCSDILDAIGQQYDFSEKFGGKSDENIIPILLGDIRSYIFTLEQYAQNPSDKSFQKRKHDFESRWTQKVKKFSSEGRVGILKAFVLTAAKLRETAITAREMELFKQLYEEIRKLSALSEFSKTKDSSDASYTLDATANNREISAYLYADVPYVGRTGVKIVRYWFEGNPVPERNGDFMAGTVSVPSASAKLAVSAITKELTKKSKALDKKQKNEKEKNSSMDLSNGLSLVGDGFSALSTAGVVEVLPGISSSSEFTAMLVKIPGNKSQKNVAPLPGTEVALIKDDDTWVTQYLRGINYVTVKSSVDLSVAKAGFERKMGRTEYIIGTDTLTFVITRYNSNATGLLSKVSTDRKKINTLWEKFKNSQMHRLADLFVNIANESSNARYELQRIYNIIIQNDDVIKNNMRKSIDKAFSNLLMSCESLAADTNNIELYDETISNFDEVLGLNNKYGKESSAPSLKIRKVK